jgi:hypothetical protein
MSKAATFVLILFATLSTAAQVKHLGGPCPTFNSTNQTISSVSSDLICVIPQVYGPGGLVGAPNHGPLGSTDQTSASFKHSVHFQSSALESFTPLTAAIGTQLGQLPITSPASGFIFSFNPSTGAVLESSQNFGPILSERPQTIGRHKLFLGFTYQYFDFDKVDGVNLRKFGAVFHHESETGGCPNPNPPISCYTNSKGQSVPVITQDFVSTQNGIGLTVNQFIAVGTFGLTSKFDLSVAIPIVNVRTDMASNATIQNIENTNFSVIPSCCVHVFSNPGLGPSQGETLGPSITIHNTQNNTTFTYNNQASFKRSSAASGIGDVLFRAKFRVLQAEKAGLAVGADVRAPTGDELNLLGSGTWGVRPFVVFGYAGRVSPHANLGLQINGDSVLAGDVTADTSKHLPNVINYSAGVDVGVSKRVTLSGDFIGLAILNAKKIINGPTVLDFIGGSHAAIANTNATLNQANISLGGKLRAFHRLLITANVLFPVNDAGLHYKPAPLIGISQTF